MKKLALLLTSLALLSGCGSSSDYPASMAQNDVSSPVAVPADQEAEVVPGALIVKFKSETNSRMRQAAHTSAGLGLIQDFPELGMSHVRIPAGITTEEAARKYRKDSNVKYVEPNYVIRLQSIPDDLLYDPYE